MHESPDDCSGSGNSIVMDASLEGEPIVGNNRNILTSCGERDDVVSEDQLEVVKKSVDSSVQERSAICQILDLSDSFLYNIFSCEDSWTQICSGHIIYIFLSGLFVKS